MSIQTLISLLASIAAIFGFSISGLIIYIRRKRRYHEEKIKECYMYLGGPQSRLGIAVSGIQKAYPSHFKTKGWFQRYAGNGDDGIQVWDGKSNKNIIGVSIYSSKKGTFPTWGSIGWWYEKQGGTTGRLGFPTAQEQQISRYPRTWVQHFEGGSITCTEGQDPRIEYNR